MFLYIKASIRDAFERPTVSPISHSVVIDVFRASTTAIAILESSPAELLIANKLETIIELAKQGYQVVSEVFNIGIDNSPTLVHSMNLHGKKVVLKSTNLTTAIEKNFSQHQMLIGSFNNMRAIVSYLQKQAAESIEINPAGFMELKEKNFEDSLCAQLFLSFLRQEKPEQDWQESLLAHVEKISTAKKHTEHYLNDLELAIQLNRSSVVPMVELKSLGLFRVANMRSISTDQV